MGAHGSALDGLHGRNAQTTGHCTDYGTTAGQVREGLNPSRGDSVWVRIPPR